LTEIKKIKINEVLKLEQLREIVAKNISETLQGASQELVFDDTKKPNVIMFIGINGAGKTTMIGKIANKLKNDGKKVLIAAADTFRAGATEQLSQWAEKSKTKLIKAERDGQDPTSVAYEALEVAKKENYDLLLIDTAGRMQNNINLMQELQKIERVIGVDKTILVIDATIGQNSLKQFESFSRSINIAGVVINKLDGTAKGGILVPIFDKFKVPIYAVGNGEKIDDIKTFDVVEYVSNLLN
jgi:fused signal recognition particle receptor